MVKTLNKEKIVNLSIYLILILSLITWFCFSSQEIITAFKKNFFEHQYYLEIVIGLTNTLFITIVSFIIGVVIGLTICLIQENESKSILSLVFKRLGKIYVSIFRGTPMVVQLLIIYFVIFAFYRGDPLYVAMIAFGLNSGAYVSEIFRGGIQAVSIGQMEAGRSLGLKYSTVMFKVIFPQAIQNALPSLGNEFVSLIKETSICGFIGAIDLTLAFRKIANATFDYQTVYLVMGFVYFLLVLLISQLLNILERKIRIINK